MTVWFSPITPWTQAVRASVQTVASDLADLDHAEIFGLRPAGHTAADLTADIAALIASGRMIDGFLAYRAGEVANQAIPVAVALAFHGTMPRVAEVGLFGRRGHARAVPAVYRELARRQAEFATTHGIRLAQVPVLKDHRAARRMIARLGGQEAFDYGPIGASGQSYVHAIWRL